MLTFAAAASERLKVMRIHQVNEKITWLMV
jgi:hypothetical protein